MSNRSYLYSTDDKPEKDAEPSLISIAEWNYDIPLISQILVSGDTQICHSAIWEDEAQIALFGDYQTGLERLKDFFCKLVEIKPKALEYTSKIVAFLERDENRKRYFFLECGEIYDMQDEDPDIQNRELLESIQSIEVKTEEVLKQLKADESDKLLEYLIAYGQWSNHLAYQFDQDSSDEHTDRDSKQSQQQSTSSEAKPQSNDRQFSFASLGVWRKTYLVMLWVVNLLLVGFIAESIFDESGKLDSSALYIPVFILGFTFWNHLAIVKRNTKQLKIILFFHIIVLNVVTFLITWSILTTSKKEVASSR